MGSWRHGCLRPKRHWSKYAGFVLLHISCISFWCHIPEGPGFSKWKWSPRSNCILQTREQKVSCSRDLSWLSWMRQKDDTPLIWLKRFQGHHGAHSGAIHTCLGFQRKTFFNSFNWPSKVLKSPSSMVNRLAVPPRLFTSSVSLLWGLAYTSKRSICLVFPLGMWWRQLFMSFIS